MGGNTIAVRITAHAVASQLCQGVGMALVSTSANRSGEPPAKSAEQCERMFGRQVRTLAGRIGKRQRPSTLIDFATGKVFRP